jgi:hypothetical protein
MAFAKSSFGNTTSASSSTSSSVFQFGSLANLTTPETPVGGRIINTSDEGFQFRPIAAIPSSTSSFSFNTPTTNGESTSDCNGNGGSGASTSFSSSFVFDTTSFASNDVAVTTSKNSLFVSPEWSTPLISTVATVGKRKGRDALSSSKTTTSGRGGWLDDDNSSWKFQQIDISRRQMIITIDDILRIESRNGIWIRGLSVLCSQYLIPDRLVICDIRRPTRITIINEPFRSDMDHPLSTSTFPSTLPPSSSPDPLLSSRHQSIWATGGGFMDGMFQTMTLWGTTLVAIRTDNGEIYSLDLEGDVTWQRSIIQAPFYVPLGQGRITITHSMMVDDKWFVITSKVTQASVPRTSEPQASVFVDFGSGASAFGDSDGNVPASAFASRAPTPHVEANLYRYDFIQKTWHLCPYPLMNDIITKFRLIAMPLPSSSSSLSSSSTIDSVVGGINDIGMHHLYAIGSSINTIQRYDIETESWQRQTIHQSSSSQPLFGWYNDFAEITFPNYHQIGIIKHTGAMLAPIDWIDMRTLSFIDSPPSSSSIRPSILQLKECRLRQFTKYITRPFSFDSFPNDIISISVETNVVNISTASAKTAFSGLTDSSQNQIWSMVASISIPRITFPTTFAALTS